MEKDPIILGERIGNGAEFVSYRNEGSVIKIPSFFGRLWQTQGHEYLHQSLEALDRHGVPRISAKVHRDLLIQTSDGKRKEITIALETPWIADYHHKMLRYADLTHPEYGEKLLREFISLIYAADAIYTQDQLGLDLIGSEALIEGLKGITRIGIGQLLKRKPQGLRGSLHNLIVYKKSLLLTDVGMQDLRPEGKWKPITKTIFFMASALLIEIAKTANRKLHADCQVSKGEIEDLPYRGNQTIQRVIRRIFERTLPLFDESHENPLRQDSDSELKALRAEA